MIRPDRFSLCREGGGGLSSLRSMLSSFAGGFALNRRFGGSETKARNRNAPFFASIFGSDLMLPLDSESCPALDVSSQSFLLDTKSSAA